MTDEKQIMKLLEENPGDYLLTDTLDFYSKHGFLTNAHYTMVNKHLKNPKALY